MLNVQIEMSSQVYKNFPAYDETHNGVQHILRLSHA